MRSRKWLTFLTWVLLSFTLVVTGCTNQANNGNQQASNNETTSGENGTETEKPQEDVTIKLGFYSGGKSDEKMKELIDKFMEKHPHITVETQSAPYGQFFQKLDTQIAANNAPDVWLSDGVFVMKYAQRGAVKDLTDWIEKDLNKDEYYGLDFNKDADGRYWAIPQGIQIGVLFYNKELFDQAGVAYPDENMTWEDLKETAAKLTLDSSGNTADASGFDAKNVQQFGLTFFSITEGWFSVLKSYGGGVLDESGMKSVVNSPENKQAMEWIVDGMNRGVLTDPLDLKGFQSSMAVFPSGSAAMRIGIYARVLAANEAGLDYDVTVLPKGPDGKRFAPVIANSWVINNKVDGAQAEAAWEWIKYWATEDEVQREWATLGEAVPVKKSVANSEVFLGASEKPANRQAFLDSFEFAGTLDANAVWEEWVSKFNENANRAFLNDVSIDEMLENADQEVQKVLDNFYKN
ncbi:ABC transporter substrate-binding protein [Marinicrinis sediminis]|uniref:ABC transporter substrate-binding protein n=1 Tax=Marinicrinis sediminis TaxID=1652465 RepID=A0ABW5R8S6_9BACL